MTTIETVVQADSDAVLHLSIPVEQANRRYKVVVVVDDSSEKSAAEDQWPDGFFDRVAGKWEGEFPEDYEGDFEERLPH